MQIKDLQQIDYAYLAGLVDADGCIQINRRKSIKNGNSYSLCLSVSQCSEQIPFYLLRKFGGNIYEGKKYKENSRAMFRWSIWAIKAKNLLINLEPYLVLKKERAKVAIEFQNTILLKGYNSHGKITEEIAEARKKLYKDMKDMNRRGGRHNYKSHTYYNIKEV